MAQAVSDAIRKIGKDYNLTEEMARIVHNLQSNAPNPTIITTMLHDYTAFKADEYFAAYYDEMIRHQGFDPLLILSIILNRVGKSKERVKEVYLMTQVGLERGNIYH